MTTMLIVEDEPRVRETLQKIIELEVGLVEVVTVGSAEEALVLCETTDFDILLSDIHLPGMSGIELANHIGPRSPKCRIILMTGLLISEDEIGPHASVLLRKPFHPRQLTQLL